MKNISIQQKISLIIVCFVCLAIWIFVGYKLATEQPFARPSVRHFIQNRTQRIHPTTASFIQSWMTFDYINHVFNIPSSVIQTALSITDKKYPRETINQYALDSHSTQTDALNKAKNAYNTYLTSTH